MDSNIIPVNKNQYIELEITGLTHTGEGVGKYEGYTLFVSGALPSEQVKIKVIKIKKNYGYGRLLEVLQPSSNRVEPLCPIYKRCGGCQLQHLKYEEQLVQKRDLVKNNLERIGKIDSVKIHDTIGMDNPWNYRNKAQIPVTEDEGKLITGFYAKGTHDVIDMEKCLIQNTTSNDITRIVRHISGEIGINAYDETTHKGILRHIITRVGINTDELMVILVTMTENFVGKEKLVERIKEEIPQATSLILNINKAKTNVIMGKKSLTLFGQNIIYDTIGDVKFAISPHSFYQVNPTQTKVLYDKALEYAGLTGEETVIDAYCGIGTISLFLAQKAKHVYGVEIVEQAIKDAKKNAELNGIDNVTFEAGAAETILPKWKENGIKADVIVVDPPRKGCDETLLNTIIELKPEKVVYVSCNPSTLARDLKILEYGGYETLEVQPVDMFPHTSHVETVVKLQRRNP